MTLQICSKFFAVATARFLHVKLNFPKLVDNSTILWYDIIGYYVKGGERLEKDRFDRFYHLISCSSKSIQRLRSIGMLPYGLTGAHTMCLRHLNNNPDGLTRTKLVRLCDIDKAQVSRIINDLCAKGYVIETENENINYRKRLKLTPMGKDISEEINRLVLDLNDFVSAEISQDELAVFYKTFDTICEKLKEAENSLEERISANG